MISTFLNIIRVNIFDNLTYYSSSLRCCFTFNIPSHLYELRRELTNPNSLLLHFFPLPHRKEIIGQYTEAIFSFGMKSVSRNTSNAILFINIQIQTEIHETPYLYSSCDILASGVYVAYHIFQNPSYIMCIPPRSSLSLITFSELIAHRSRYHAQHKRNPSPTLACQYAH